LIRPTYCRSLKGGCLTGRVHLDILFSSPSNGSKKSLPKLLSFHPCLLIRLSFGNWLSIIMLEQRGVFRVVPLARCRARRRRLRVPGNKCRVSPSLGETLLAQAADNRSPSQQLPCLLCYLTFYYCSRKFPTVQYPEPDEYISRHHGLFKKNKRLFDPGTPDCTQFLCCIVAPVSTASSNFYTS
jgi:hypothetical protein